MFNHRRDIDSFNWRCRRLRKVPLFFIQPPRKFHFLIEFNGVFFSVDGEGGEEGEEEGFTGEVERGPATAVIDGDEGVEVGDGVVGRISGQIEIETASSAVIDWKQNVGIRPILQRWTADRSLFFQLV